MSLYKTFWTRLHFEESFHENQLKHMSIYESPQYRRFKMEAGDNKVEIELSKDRKSYAGIPEADFVVSVIY